MKRFGEKLRFLREKHGITQQKLAEELGVVSHSFIYKLETGEKRPNVEHAIKVARLFGISLDDLLLDEHDLEGMGGQAGE